MQKIKKSQWLTFSQQQIWLLTFTYHYQNKAYEEYQKLQEIVQSIQISQKTKINGNISGGKKIHIQKLLQVPPQRDTTTKTFLMDLEIQMLQQIESLLMVTPNGQTQH
jgi:hypothetical protein